MRQGNWFTKLHKVGGLVTMAHRVQQEHEVDCMPLPMFHLFSVDNHGNPVWLEAVADIETANLRLRQLASASPSEYFVFDLHTRQVHTRLVSAIEPERQYPMRSHHYDIVRKEGNESAIWLEAAPDLNTAESRIHELTSFWPGEFQIIDQQNHQIVERIIGRSDRTEGPDSLTLYKQD
jgi:hypothetical protein